MQELRRKRYPRDCKDQNVRICPRKGGYGRAPGYQGKVKYSIERGGTLVEGCTDL
jgi:hypothetical protein